MGRTISRKAGRVSRRGKTDAAADLLRSPESIRTAVRSCRHPFMVALIDPRLMAWVTKWEKMRIGWMEMVENLIEQFPIAHSVNSLEWMEREIMLMFQISARKYRLEMKWTPDEE
jgi:hypothetical protein